MKAIKSLFLSCIAISFIQCAGEVEKSTETLEKDDVALTEVKEVIDTIPVMIVQIKIMGKESMIQGYYKEGQTEEEIISGTEEGDFEKLINVDVKGSPFGQEDNEGYTEDATGAVLKKSTVFNMLYLNTGEVDQPFRVSVRTNVKDFKAWRWLYDAQEKNRHNAGMTQLQLGINKEDSSEVFLLIAIPDIAKAREMMEKPGLDEKMEESGVIGKPMVKFWRPAGPQSEQL